MMMFSSAFLLMWLLLLRFCENILIEYLQIKLAEQYSMKRSEIFNFLLIKRSWLWWKELFQCRIIYKTENSLASCVHRMHFHCTIVKLIWCCSKMWDEKMYSISFFFVKYFDINFSEHVWWLCENLNENTSTHVETVLCSSQFGWERATSANSCLEEIWDYFN